MTKEKLLEKINFHITTLSNFTSPPVDHIANLQKMKGYVEVATPEELKELNSIWRELFEGKIKVQRLSI